MTGIGMNTYNSYTEWCQMPTRIQLAKPEIVQFFDASTSKVFSRLDLNEIFRNHQEPWRLTVSFTASQLIEYLTKNSFLRKLRIQSGDDKEIFRYFWREEPSVFEVAQSIHKGAYLSHGTAVFLHGLTDLVPFTIYVNKEQSQKAPFEGKLSQEDIDQSFKGKQRASGQIFKYRKYQIVLINGKNTGRLEVGSIQGDSDRALETTKLERTLIDIVVRPSYAGGVYQVLDAFRAAKSKLSANLLQAILKKLNYRYPYHQAIGFYLERSGYEATRWKRFLDMGQSHNFYLAHDIQDPDYDSKWKLFYPKGF